MKDTTLLCYGSTEHGLWTNVLSKYLSGYPLKYDDMKEKVKGKERKKEIYKEFKQWNINRWDLLFFVTIGYRVSRIIYQCYYSLPSLQYRIP